MTIYWINHKPHIAVNNGFKELRMAEVLDLYERNQIKRSEVLEND
ncbi:hypothetical protein [Priestia flexa]|nr:hypothetical protein [Priestia flexa]